jgi:2,4-dienoyl-CoA reductase-like NADH-dependent reductase (Old Yellow Enzyme family)
LDTLKYRTIFSPLSVGPIYLPNRIFFPPWCFNWANSDGTMSEKLYDFYLDLAAGGCGMIITGCAAVSPDSLLYEKSMKIYEKKHADSFKKLCREIKSRGAIPAIQLMNFGRQSVTTWTGLPVYAPSAIPCPVKSLPSIDPAYRIREMTHDDLERVRNDFIHAAILAVEAGFTVIQVHAANGFLLSEFISPYTNKRTDEYGGSIENRMRFVVEIIKGIKREIQGVAALDIRISADEFVPGGIKPEDHLHIIPLLEEAGVDMLNIGFTVSETTGTFFRQNIAETGEAPYRDIVQQLRTYSRRKLPVGYAGFIASLDTAEELLNENKMDLVGMGRAQVADPYLIQKTLIGKPVDKCIWCHRCLFSFAQKAEKQVYCSINKKYQKTENV